ncbi:MAG TPA: hypothetical protein VGH32_10390 [Pirellulales bacterium]
MCNPDSALQRLADRIDISGASPNRVREALEASLIPLVRRALRHGAGFPQLVQWVQRTLPQVQAGQDRTRPVDPEIAAPPLARLLCATLLRKRMGRPNGAIMDTVVGA